MGSNNVDDPKMPQVGTIIKHPTYDFQVIRVLASGPFSDVFIVRETRSSKLYAMKVEREEGNIRPVLKLDVFVLTQLGVHIGFPQLLAAYRTKYYKFAVMQLVGPDLGRLRRAMPGKRFSTSTALQICIQTLRRIETLHDLGWLCRDIKAPNFAIGSDDRDGIVYMLDFGFARRYRDKFGNLLPPRPAAALLGTIHYASLASHQNQEQCRRDDLESWLYMCVELCAGSLPWAKLDPLKHHKIICDWKQFIRVHGRELFFQDCPEELDHILSIIDSLSFTDRPHYEMMEYQLRLAQERLNLDPYAKLDWQHTPMLKQKANFVGEIGQSNQASLEMRNFMNPASEAMIRHAEQNSEARIRHAEDQGMTGRPEAMIRRPEEESGVMTAVEPQYSFTNTALELSPRNKIKN
ncbi:unnamed protein product [Bursaphelenchus okinawaensis]|uniref:Protein kinase domain-containing protein n=1 Tax=Bursaphelenchus okinawaensis TaxID=465554 RepID=A0A811KCJ1_9BILA|nr:unnamed protein product [Bursaphelenchus okinawaensis]CAG9098334.1 unnamed protein product [Bursaphelenchus okinawaensis]